MIFTLTFTCVILSVASSIPSVIFYRIAPIDTTNKTTVKACLPHLTTLWTFSEIIWISVLLLIIITMILLYISIFSTVLKRIRKDNGNFLNKAENLKRKETKSQLKSAAMLFGVTFVFICIFIPWLVSLAVIQKKNQQNINIEYLNLLNHTTNFFIYLIFQETFRKRIKNFFLSLPSKNRISTVFTLSSYSN